MRIRLAATWLCSLGLVGLPVAQLRAQGAAPSAAERAEHADVELVGNRFPPLT